MTKMPSTGGEVTTTGRRGRRRRAVVVVVVAGWERRWATGPRWGWPGDGGSEPSGGDGPGDRQWQMMTWSWVGPRHAHTRGTW